MTLIRSWRATLLALVLVAGALGGAIVLLARANTDTADEPAQPPVVDAWWSGLLQYVPASDSYSGAEIYLANPEVAYSALGVDLVPCPRRTLKESLDALPLDRDALAETLSGIPPGTDVGNVFVDDKDLIDLIGFEHCHMLRTLQVTGERFEDQFSIADVSVNPKSIDAALRSAEFDRELTSGGRIYTNKQNIDELDYFWWAMRAIALRGSSFLAARERDTIEHALSARRDASSSMLNDEDVPTMLQALGDFDAVIVVSTALPPEFPPFSIRDGGIPPFLPALAPDFESYSWGRLDRPKRVAFAHELLGGVHAMRVALRYERESQAADNANELENRMRDFRPFSDDLLCDNVDARAIQDAMGSTLVVECRGGRAHAWYNIATSGLAWFLVPSLPGSFPIPAG